MWDVSFFFSRKGFQVKFGCTPAGPVFYTASPANHGNAVGDTHETFYLCPTL